MTNNTNNTLNDTLEHSLSTPGEKDVPSADWASSTLKALGPITTEPYPPDKPYNTYTNYPSIPPTPSDRFPGAYPRGPIDPRALSQDVEYVKEAATHALETAKGYAYSAGEVFGKYLPQSVTPYLSRSANTSEHEHAPEPEDPTSEELPGPHGEFLGDAQVPDNVETTTNERSPEGNNLLVPSMDTSEGHLDVADQYSTAPSSKLQGASENASTRSLPGSRVDHWNYTPGASLCPSSSRRESLKNTDTFSASAGPLQAATSESQTNSDTIDEKFSSEEPAVALPSINEFASTSTGPHASPPITKESSTTSDERISSHRDPSPHSNSLATNTVTSGNEEPKAKEHVSAAVATTEQKDVSSILVPSSSNDNPFDRACSPVDAPENDLTEADTTMDGHRHRPDDHPKIQSSPTTASNNITNSDDISPTPSKSKFKSKPGFMDKLRGEIKILSGRLEHRDDKIEEGRRLMGKVPKLVN